MFKNWLKVKNITKEQFDEMTTEKQAELQGEYLEHLESEIDNRAKNEDVDNIKDELKTIKENSDLTEVNKTIDKLEQKIEGLKELRSKREDNKTTLKAGLKAAIEKNKNLPDAQKQINIVVKADNLFNIQVIDGGDFDADEANLDALLLNESAIETGFAADLRRELTILNEMRNATPLRIGDALKWIEPQDASGKPLTVKEANKKPVGAVKYVRKSKESTKIAIYFQIAEEFLNRADFLMTEVNTHFRELVTEVLEEKAFDATDGILSYATDYVNPTGYKVPNPTRLDAISAIATSMKLNKYKATHVVMNAADISMMFADKATDGHYILANGTTVQLLDQGQTLVVGTRRMKVMEVDGDLLDIGEVVLIDWNKLKYGLGAVRMKSDPYTNMRDNILNFLMEAPFAVARPTNYPYAVVKDSFATVIAAITET